MTSSLTLVVGQRLARATEVAVKEEKVLVLDDDSTIAEIAAAVLVDGYEVVAASHLDEGLRMVESEHLDLILVDHPA